MINFHRKTPMSFCINLTIEELTPVLNGRPLLEMGLRNPALKMPRRISEL
jgi:hypothetical protein